MDDGEFVVFVGPSGCGKSTLLRLIAGLEAATDGRILIGDRDVVDASPADRGIAMVFQSYALYPHMTVAQNLSFGLENTRTPKAEIRERVLEAARMLEIEPFLDRRPRELSGGQRQRVAIGRAIVRHPAVFLFDEPLSNLDAALRVQTRAEITKLHRRLGATMIYVTHDQVEAMTMADRIAVLNGGRLEQFGRPLELFEAPVNRFVAGFIGSPRMNFYPRAITALDGNRAAMTVPGFGHLAFTVDPVIAAGAVAIELGIRPAHFAVGTNATSQSATAPTADFLVDYAESIGTETYIYGTIAGNDAASVLHVPDHLEAREGDRLPVAPMLARAHVFRADDGRTLAARPAAL